MTKNSIVVNLCLFSPHKQILSNFRKSSRYSYM